jgi:hypothetical protein
VLGGFYLGEIRRWRLMFKPKARARSSKLKIQSSNQVQKSNAILG